VREAGSLVDSLLDFEISLIKAFHWSLHAIDATSMDSMFLFIYRLTGEKKRMAFADEVGWL